MGRKHTIQIFEIVGKWSNHYILHVKKSHNIHFVSLGQTF